VLYVGASVCGSWARVQRGTCHVGSCSDLYTVLLVCLYFLAILVCNFACDLCCFIVNVYSVESSVELMLYCFILCRIKLKFSYLILSMCKFTCTPYTCIVKTMLSLLHLSTYLLDLYIHFTYSNLKQTYPTPIWSLKLVGTRA
jgi:hypothetical protein